MDRSALGSAISRSAAALTPSTVANEFAAAASSSSSSGTESQNMAAKRDAIS
jgi:hypothetical protein